MKNYDRCTGCIGKCPEICEKCIFNYCKKQVDYALTENRWFKSMLMDDYN